MLLVAELLVLGLVAIAAGVAAWRIPKLGRDWRWSTGARALGLVVSGDCRAWGQLDGREVVVRWTDGPVATLRLGASGPLDRVAEVRNRLGSQVALGYAGLPGDYRWRSAEEARDAGRIGLAALQDLPHSGELTFSMTARAGDEERLLALVARLAVWLAGELGWHEAPAPTPERPPQVEPRARGATPPPLGRRRVGEAADDRERLSARLTKLRAGAPAGALHRQPREG